MKSVNFIIAVNSGRRFRPVNWNESIDGNGWYSWSLDCLFFHDEKVNRTLDVKLEMLNYHYDLEENKIEISLDDFEKLYMQHTVESKRNIHTGAEISFIDMNALKKDMGFFT